jgi:selenocysteine lyase/cysteine desulfurase
MLCSEAREQFIGLNNKTFLDAACVSLIPEIAKKEIYKFLEHASLCPFRDASEHHIALDRWRLETLDYIALLFGVTKNRIALIENTTNGLNIAANSIDFKHGDEVVIADTEFLQVAIPFVKKQEQNIIKINKIITPKNNIINLDLIKNYINKNTKALCISSVQWCTGARLDLLEVGAFCRDNNIWLIVDGIQEAGALSVNLSEIYCDFYIAGGHKWLNAPYGCGFMIMSDKALRLRPQSFGYLALKEPEGGWGSYFRDPNASPFGPFNFLPEAKSFESGGTTNYPGAIGLGASLRLVNLITIKNIENHITKLTSLLHEELKRKNYIIISPENSSYRSAITVFRGSPHPEDNLVILNKLLDHNILLSMRYSSGRGGLRVSTHYFNNEDDVMKLCDALPLR